jgi:hypothetical protein
MRRRLALAACLMAPLVMAAAGPARAESLRCQGQSAQVGDSRLSVLHKCGEPLLRDQYCAPVYGPHSPHPVPQPWAGWVAPCIPVDEWLYDRGPGNLMATVRFRAGVVQSIEYGRQPR